jgi:triacylglycerol esterase/lipase EstA (alpha/beta hydrolase family)
MPHSTRTHVVLIPGFGGFDMLGQVRYYTGITGLFEEWQKANPRADLALHYFDNLPTSAVITRAERLRIYLAKRLARGEFVHGATYGERDKVILVGHSTGGLDARRLMYDLRDLQRTGRTIPVDGQEREVEPSDLLDLVRGLVFLSVPQYGTNIADWVLSHTLEREALIGIAAVTASKAARDVPWQLMDSLKTHFAGWREVVIGLGGAIPHALSGLGPLASTLAAAGSAISVTDSNSGLKRIFRDLNPDLRCVTITLNTRWEHS